MSRLRRDATDHLLVTIRTRRFFVGILDIVFPRRCLGCGKLGCYFCQACRTAIRIIGPRETICPVCEKPALAGMTHPHCRTRYTIDGLTSVFCYDGIVRQAVKTLKYRYVSDLASEFISLIPPFVLDELPSRRPNEATIVPIPLHPSRLRDRGFNHAEVLGRCLADRLQTAITTDILRRIRKTAPQVEMRNRTKRLANMEGAFAVTPRFDKLLLKHGKIKSLFATVVLFDDVFTTGATMRDAAQVLKRSGVTTVWGMTMAR